MSSAHARGPRGAPSRVGGRGGGGGIQKRRGGGAGPVRVDKDGDMVMDAVVDKRRSGKGRLDSPKPQTSGRPGPGARQPPTGPARGVASQKAQQAIMRGLNGKQANIVDSRISSLPTTVQIKGLQESKAASNSDGGLEALLGFLERKAKPGDILNRTIKIKKVCLLS